MALNGPEAPRWGDFAGRCLASACSANADLFLPDGQALGLVKTASYLLGTWRTADGEMHRFLRGIQPFQSPHGCYVFSTRGATHLARQSEQEAQTYRGGISTRAEGDTVRFAPVNGRGFSHRINADKAEWAEDGLLHASGVRSAQATQWYNPWRDGGGAFCVTTKFRGQANIFGLAAEGFFAHEVHYFPRDRDFINSPFGFGGREILWGHMATEFVDGRIIDASIGIGADGWGFTLVQDEQGVLHAATDVSAEAIVNANGLPAQVTFRFLDQTWVWRIEPKGERAITRADGLVGAEGVLRREGDTRPVKAAMGTIDWWLDGRAAAIIKR